MFGVFRRKSSVASEEIPEVVKEVSKYYEVGEFTDDDCENCSVCFPKNLKVDQSPLFNTAPAVSGQLIVATGQTNWTHDIGDETSNWGRVCRALAESSEVFSKVLGGKVRINGSNLEYDDADAENKVSVTILPHFVRILTTPETCVEQVTDVLRLRPEDKIEFTPQLKHVPERGYILLCSHTTRDRRCGITAPLMKRALDMELREKGLYRDPDDEDEGGIRVVLVNHLGGHKFVANALIYQRNGMAIMLARLRPEHCKALVEKTIENGVIPPDHVRFCTKVPAYSW